MAPQTEGEASILILSSSMGAGHGAVSAELGRRLVIKGFQVRVIDMVEELPLGTGRLLRWFYSALLKWSPATYEAIFARWLLEAQGSRSSMSPVTWLLAKKVIAKVSVVRPAAIVSTFHVWTQAVGELRTQGKLSVPVCNVIVDFFVHGAWVNPGVDLNLCIHESSRRQAAALSTDGSKAIRSMTIVSGPLVANRFNSGFYDRHQIRRELGIGSDQRAILISGGAWGAGGLARTVEDVCGIGGIFPVVVCGRNGKLLKAVARKLSQYGSGVAFGWVDDMPRLMAAVDVYIDNAGGTSAFEAAAMDVKIIGYRPIPGHGIRNIEAMHAAGVANYARNPTELSKLLNPMGEGRGKPIGRSDLRALSGHQDPVDSIISMIGGSES